jgi:Fatty acid desaturase
MAFTLKLTDPMAAPSYPPTRFQRWCESLVFDPRDALFVRHSLKMVALMSACFYVLAFHFSYGFAAIFLVLWGLLLPTVILMLHNTMHRPFLRRFTAFNRGIAYAMAFFFGIPTVYMAHHVGMHHPENNLKADLSSTMKYERDNAWHFVRYFFHCVVTALFALPGYLAAHKRTGLAVRAITEELVRGTVVLLAVWWNPHFGVVAMLIPALVVPLLMFMGNWGQHAFVDASNPNSGLLNSVTCINCDYNKNAYNDGYHIGHHEKANRHWSEMPQDFLDNLAAYRKVDAVVFEGLDNFLVALLILTRRYDVLARRFVRLDGVERSDEDVIRLLKQRTRPIGDEAAVGALVAG